MSDDQPNEQLMEGIALQTFWLNMELMPLSNTQNSEVKNSSFHNWAQNRTNCVFDMSYAA